MNVVSLQPENQQSSSGKGKEEALKPHLNATPQTLKVLPAVPAGVLCRRGVRRGVPRDTEHLRGKNAGMPKSIGMNRWLSGQVRKKSNRWIVEGRVGFFAPLPIGIGWP